MNSFERSEARNLITPSHHSNRFVRYLHLILTFMSKEVSLTRARTEAMKAAHQEETRFSMGQSLNDGQELMRLRNRKVFQLIASEWSKLF